MMNTIAKALLLFLSLSLFSNINAESNYKWISKNQSKSDQITKDSYIFYATIEDYEEKGENINRSEINSFYYDLRSFMNGEYTLIMKDKEGKKVREATVKDGKMGKETWWYVSGTKQMEANWKYSGTMVSKTIYYANGNKESELKEDGTSTVWFKNGTVRITQKMVKGLRDGEYKQYYENGNLAQQGRYENGKRVGNWSFYTEEGEELGVKAYP